MAGELNTHQPLNLVAWLEKLANFHLFVFVFFNALGATTIDVSVNFFEILKINFAIKVNVAVLN